MLKVMALALLLALAVTAPVEATVRGTHVSATLVAESAWIRPGRLLTVGLRLRMDAEWHTYWKNPGDSGLATRIRWTLPPGFEAGPIAWPRPERFASDPLASYGYDGEVLLLSQIRTPPDLAVGTPVAIGARVDWLECRDVCKPGRGELTLRLDVKDLDPSPDPGWAKAFAEARGRLPRERPPWSLAGSSAQKSLTLQARGAAPAPREAYFFPGRPDLVEHGAAQRLTTEKGGFRLEIPMSANAKAPDKVEGVLVADGVGYEVSAPVRSPNPIGEKP
jgi:DsbC/DsbD-like thiol-disulfide interchange protein